MTDQNHKVHDVAVAVICDQHNRICISKRHADAHQGGLWEFPGGKLEPGESVEHALRREIIEELGIHIATSRPLIRIHHDYGDKAVCLHVHKVLDFTGEAAGREGQDVEWVELASLAEYNFPVANIPIMKSITLPDRYLITGKFHNTGDYLRRLHTAVYNGISLIQLRLKAGAVPGADNARVLVQQTAEYCAKNDVSLMLNIAPEYMHKIDLESITCSGLHADSRMLDSLQQRPSCSLFSASCHDEAQIQKALELDADFMVLSPVKYTSSHPDTEPMGWQRFAELVEQVPVPVYALGGVGETDIEDAWRHGGQGVAAISAFWPE